MPDKKIEALELLSRSITSMEMLTTHRRSLDKEHMERYKRLRSMHDAIHGWHKRGDFELPGFEGISFSPEDLQLLHFPLQGLDDK